MKVYLLKDVPKLGRKGEIKEVSEGYFKNYLSPHQLAILATPQISRQVEIKEKQKLIQQEKENQKLKQLAEEIKDKTITIKTKVGQKDQLFEAVSSRKILEALSLLGKEKIKVILDEPIKKIGAYEVKLQFGSQIVVPLKIKVEKES